MDNEHREFYVDVLVTFAESRPYSWFEVENYRWWYPDLAGGTAKPHTDENGVSHANVTGKVRVMDPEQEEGTWKEWQDLDVAIVAKGFEVLLAGQVEGLHENGRTAILSAYHGLDAGEIDANDVDTIIQIGMCGFVPFS